MKSIADYNELLAVDQATRLVTERAAGLVCDEAVADGLRFSRSYEGLYAVVIPTRQRPELAILGLSSETPPHDERYVAVQLDEQGAEFRYVGYSDVTNYGRANDINLRLLGSTFDYVLRWSPDEHVIKEGGNEDDNKLGFNRVGFKLNALPLVLEAIKETDPNTIYPSNHYNSRAKRADAKRLFIEFAEAVLILPES